MRRCRHPLGRKRWSFSTSTHAGVKGFSVRAMVNCTALISIRIYSRNYHVNNAALLAPKEIFAHGGRVWQVSDSSPAPYPNLSAACPHPTFPVFRPPYDPTSLRICNGAATCPFLRARRNLGLAIICRETDRRRDPAGHRVEGGTRRLIYETTNELTARKNDWERWRSCCTSLSSPSSPYIVHALFTLRRETRLY